MMLQSKLLFFILIFSTHRATTTQCNHYSANGIDYADANVTVVPGETPDDCCAACVAWNANVTPSRNCSIVVWYNTPPRSCGIKATMRSPIKGVRVAALQPRPGPPPTSTFRFATSYGSGMVLQAAPARAKVWGFTASAADAVTVQLGGGDAVSATVVPDVDDDGKPVFLWSALLPAITASFAPHNVSATSTSKSGIQAGALLSEVLFGDVWACSGQR